MTHSVRSDSRVLLAVDLGVFIIIQTDRADQGFKIKIRIRALIRLLVVVTGRYRLLPGNGSEGASSRWFLGICSETRPNAIPDIMSLPGKTIRSTRSQKHR